MSDDLKVWWVFGIDQYYPCGGLGDLKGTFETEKEADWYANKIDTDFDNVEVLDISSRLGNF